MDRIAGYLRRLCGGCLLLVLAVAVGAAAGVLDTIFGKGVDLLTHLRTAQAPWLLALLPLAGLAICFGYETFGPECRRGMRMVFDTFSGKRERVPAKLIPMAVGATWISHLFGASVGREGVAVQMAATVGSLFGRPLKNVRARRILLMAGVAAGFGGLFRTPLTATVFAAELFHLGAAEYIALLPALAAACTASTVSGLLGLGRFSAELGAVPVLDAPTLARLAVLGGLCGLAGMLFARGMHFAQHELEKRLPNPYLRIALAGLLAAAAGYCSDGRYNGVGETLVAEPFGGTVYGWDWLAKMLMTILCLSAGYQGGEVLPLFTVGATLGVTVGPLLGLPPALAAGLGYTAVFCGGTNTFFAAVMVGAELFGMQYLPLFFLVCAMAYTCNGNHSIYPQFKADFAGLTEYKEAL